MAGFEDEPAMTISTIVCTFNRAASLQATLQSLARARVPDGCSWELVVVDNNSTDATQAVIESFLEDHCLPVRNVRETTPGLSHARNRGIAVATGDILTFTDDDVLVDPDWLVRIAEAFAEHGPAVVGGRILPLWETPPPRWLDSSLYAYLALADYGDDPLCLKTPKVWGANLSFRADVFAKYGRFSTSLGRAPGKLYAGEEVELLRTLLREGEKVLYYPAAVVHHRIGGHRTTKNYFRQWRYDQGELEAINRDGDQAHAIARELFGLIVRELPRYAAHAMLGSPGKFTVELRICHALGRLSGARKIRRAGPEPHAEGRQEA